MKLFAFLCCLMFLQGSMAYFSLKIMGMASFQTDITKTLTPIKGQIMKMESSLAALLKEVNAQTAVPTPLMTRMPVDILIAYGKMVNALLNNLSAYVADSSLTVPRIMALMEADVKAITDFVSKYTPETKGADLDTTFTTTKFGPAITAINGATMLLGDTFKMLSTPLQMLYGTIIPLAGGSATIDTTITSVITAQVGIFATNIVVIQDSSDGLTKTIAGSNKMLASIAMATSSIPAAITSTASVFSMDAAAAIKAALMGFTTNSKAMLTAYATFTAKLQSSYSDTAVGFIIPDTVKMVDEYVAMINQQMAAIYNGVSMSTLMYSDAVATSGSFTSDTTALEASLKVSFGLLQEGIQTSFKKNTDSVRMCLAAATKSAVEIVNSAKTLLGLCAKSFAKKFSTSEKSSATSSLSIKSGSSNFAKALTDCMGSTYTKKATVTCINTIVTTSFAADITSQTTVSTNAVTAIGTDFMMAEADYLMKCAMGVQSVVTMSVDSFGMVCQA